jgi:hypothetical protein
VARGLTEPLFHLVGVEHLAQPECDLCGTAQNRSSRLRVRSVRQAAADGEGVAFGRNDGAPA